ncbi:hypothetical protein Q5M87_11205 [Brachyspira innocens]|uniref:Large polyvalent protein-associated domain-containing protein n=1 Tax=Brachyspira innocens TaxID=13264 RepID=A0ABT8YYA9_9SPIR|nr:hypothetical protein [Brachyspira innocens]MDO6994572.1 hypothetical protein [Brachyspira innocens]MDO7020848.1 hypothetical protein [Brachyspira innocens]
MLNLFKILDFLEKNIFQVAPTLKNNKEEKQKEICKLKNIDWTKDNILPNFPKSFLKKQGLEDKPILLKKNIIDRNKQQHPDITEEQAIRILGNSLYKTEAVLKGKSKRPDYYNLITRIDDKHNDLVTVELSNEKDNYEIVHFFVIRNTTRKKYERDDDE